MTLSVSFGFGMHLLNIEFSNREKLLLTTWLIEHNL